MRHLGWHISQSNFSVAVGCRVMLRKLLWAESGLVNGIIGIAHKIKCITDEESSHLEMLTVHVHTKCPSFCGPMQYNCVITVITVRVLFQKLQKLCTKVTASSTCLFSNKLQRITLERDTGDIGHKEWSYWFTYVALSRVRTVGGFIKRPKITRQQFCRINNDKTGKEEWVVFRTTCVKKYIITYKLLKEACKILKCDLNISLDLLPRSDTLPQKRVIMHSQK